MTRYNNIQDCHLALATGDDAGGGRGLTAWRNADLVYEALELKPTDQFLGWYNRAPVKITEEIGKMTNSRISGRYSKNRQLGEWRSKHAFQTCQFIYWLMQTPGTPTQEGVPAGYNTHTLTKGTTNIPDWHGLQLEREGITSKELRYAMMGFCPRDLVINCSPTTEGQKATQEITIPYAYLNRAASDIAAQTKRNDQAKGSAWKTWDHAINGNGVGKAPSGLTYGSTPAQLEVDVIDLSIKLHRDNFIGGVPDNSGYYRIGLMLGWKYSVLLDVQPTGDLLYTVNNTDKESYDHLDYHFSFEANATYDDIDFNFNEMYMIPFDEDNDWKKSIEGYTITLEPLDETSSLTVIGMDCLDKTHFENP